MSYCLNAQVAEEFNGITAFGASTSPTDTTVDRWIAEADQFIDSKVGLRYIVPITNSADLIVIRMISILLVSARVRRRLNRVGPESETAKVKAADSDKTAMMMLQDIVAGKTNLPGSTLANSSAGVSSFNVDHNECFEFRRNCDNW